MADSTYIGHLAIKWPYNANKCHRALCCWLVSTGPSTYCSLRTSCFHPGLALQWREARVLEVCIKDEYVFFPIQNASLLTICACSLNSNVEEWCICCFIRTNDIYSFKLSQYQRQLYCPSYSFSSYTGFIDYW